MRTRIRTLPPVQEQHKRTVAELMLLQSLPLETKILWATQKIVEWYEFHKGNVYVAFSGGKDSTVLLDLVRSIYPDVVAVFCDTGLEWPEIREFVKTIDNVTWIKPTYTFNEVLNKYGYPLISKDVSQKIYDYRNTKSEYFKHRILNGTEKSGGKSGKLQHKWRFLLDAPFPISDKCCRVLKKDPFNRYAKQSKQFPITGVMAENSRRRLFSYIDHGCNMYDAQHPQSKPLSIWTEQDALQYVFEHNLSYCSIYGEISKDRIGKFSCSGENRTGCVYCGFGLVGSGRCENKFQRMKKSHPQLWKYCMDNLKMREVLEFCKIPIEKEGFVY